MLYQLDYGSFMEDCFSREISNSINADTLSPYHPSKENVFPNQLFSESPVINKVRRYVAKIWSVLHSILSTWKLILGLFLWHQIGYQEIHIMWICFIKQHRPNPKSS